MINYQLFSLNSREKRLTGCYFDFNGNAQAMILALNEYGWPDGLMERSQFLKYPEPFVFLPHDKDER